MNDTIKMFSWVIGGLLFIFIMIGIFKFIRFVSDYNYFLGLCFIPLSLIGIYYEIKLLEKISLQNARQKPLP